MATMVGTPEEMVGQIIRSGSRRFRGLKLSNFDFSGMDLQRADFRNASVPYANFSNCNLKFANFESANCYGANFDGADCHRINFKDATLSDAILTAKDLFGATITLECGSFKGTQVGKAWWYGFLFYGLLMKAPSAEEEEKLIALLGPERYMVLRDQYQRRRM